MEHFMHDYPDEYTFEGYPKDWSNLPEYKLPQIEYGDHALNYTGDRQHKVCILTPTERTLKDAKNKPDIVNYISYSKDHHFRIKVGQEEGENRWLVEVLFKFPSTLGGGRMRPCFQHVYISNEYMTEWKLQDKFETVLHEHGFSWPMWDNQDYTLYEQRELPVRYDLKRRAFQNTKEPKTKPPEIHSYECIIPKDGSGYYLSEGISMFCDPVLTAKTHNKAPKPNQYPETNVVIL